MLLLTSSFVKTACSTDESAAKHKCDTVRCWNDRECESYDCNDEGICWDWNNRPSCNNSIDSSFYKCTGVRCSRDIECWALDCYQNVCQKGNDNQMSGGVIAFIVIFTLLLLGLAVFLFFKCRNKKIDNNLNQYKEVANSYPNQN